MKQAQRMVGWRLGVTLILSYCGALALSMQFPMPDLSAAQQANALTEIVWNLRSSLAGTSVTSTLLFAGLAGLGMLVYRMKEETTTPWMLLPVSFLIALVWLAGSGFRINDTLESLDASPGQVVKSTCYVLGCTYLLYQLSQLLFCFLEQKAPERVEKKGRLAGLYHRHSFGMAFCAVLICWLPYLIVCYPGYTCYDTWNQISQFLGVRTFTADHPPIHTLFLGMFAQLGIKIGSGNIGLYLSIVVQAFIAAAVFAYGLFLMERWKTPKWLLVGSFCSIVVVPYYTSYMSMAIKDDLYSVFFVLFIEESICILEKKQDYFSSWGHRILLTASILGTLLFRNNGPYALYPTVAFLLAYIWGTWGKKIPKKGLAKVVAGFLIPIVLANGLFMTATAHYGTKKGNIKEALSLPFQQTARYVLERGNEVTEEEAEAIRAVLDYDYLGEKYNPRISDPVKNTYKAEATKEELLNYLSVWFRQFLKHPEIYIKATLNQNYYLLYPFTENVILYETAVVQTPYTEAANELLNIHEVEALSEAKMAMRGIYRTVFSLPVVGQLSHQAPYNLLLIALFVFAVYQKKGKWLLISVPLILSDIIIVLAPVIQFAPRYAFPIIYSMPVVFAYYIRVVKSEDQRSDTVTADKAGEGTDIHEW